MLFSYIPPTEPSEPFSVSFVQWGAAARVAVALVVVALIWGARWQVL